MVKNQAIGETVKSQAQWMGGRRVEPQRLHKILIYHYRGTWQPLGLPHVTFELVHLDHADLIMSYQFSTCNSPTYTGIFSLLSGMYGCPVSILVKLFQNFVCLVKWSTSSNFLIRTLFWTKQVALGLFHRDGRVHSAFERFRALWFWAISCP